MNEWNHILAILSFIGMLLIGGVGVCIGWSLATWKHEHNHDCWPHNPEDCRGV